jgi:hypothetical protein
VPIKITFNYCQAIRIVTFKMINAKRQTPNAKRQTPITKQVIKKTAFKNAVSKGSY